MILDLLSHAPVYRSLGHRFDAGLTWLTAFVANTADGRYDIDGNDIYALVQSYQTVPQTEKKYESHRVYADIQFIAEGSELIYYAPIRNLQPVTEYDEQKDFLLHGDPSAATPLLIAKGSFAIFFPQDGHKPGCIADSANPVKKVVIKIRL